MSRNAAERMPRRDLVPVLSLWQPWATLIALGVKTIETRSWLLNYRGFIAVHSARRPPTAGLTVGGWTCWPPVSQHNRLTASWMLTPPGAGDPVPLPLGMLVATARVVDCLPMTGWADLGDPECIVVHDDSIDHAMLSDKDQPRDIVPDGAHLIRDVTDQMPFGDFSPGRYAWMLEDVTALPAPLEFRGGQGLNRKVPASRVGLRSPA